MLSLLWVYMLICEHNYNYAKTTVTVGYIRMEDITVHLTLQIV